MPSQLAAIFALINSLSSSMVFPLRGDETVEGRCTLEELRKAAGSLLNRHLWDLKRICKRARRSEDDRRAVPVSQV